MIVIIAERPCRNNAIIIDVPYPILSITKLNNIILMQNGHSPTPKISPFWVSLRANSTPQSPITWVLTIKPNDVAVRAAKQPQKSQISFLLGLVS